MNSMGNQKLLQISTTMYRRLPYPTPAKLGEAK